MSSTARPSSESISMSTSTSAYAPCRRARKNSAWQALLQLGHNLVELIHHVGIRPQAAIGGENFGDVVLALALAHHRSDRGGDARGDVAIVDQVLARRDRPMAGDHRIEVQLQYAVQSLRPFLHASAVGEI